LSASTLRQEPRTASLPRGACMPATASPSARPSRTGLPMVECLTQSSQQGHGPLFSYDTESIPHQPRRATLTEAASAASMSGTTALDRRMLRLPQSRVVGHLPSVKLMRATQLRKAASEQQPPKLPSFPPSLRREMTTSILSDLTPNAT
jgi:hypothetical protein